jgi:dienelactone hydrolase
VARDTSERSARAGYVALARALLTRARELTANASGIAQGTPEQTELLATVDAALRDVDILR